MKGEIKIEFHVPSSFLLIKEEVWEVCKLLYNLDEKAYYARLSTFSDFAVFRKEGKIIGFLSFFVDEVVIDSKSLVLVGIGHGGILPEFRNKRLIPITTLKYIGKKAIKKPFTPHFLWGLGMTHLSYRMGMRGTKFQYPTAENICPPLYRHILDWLGEKYYKDTYCNTTFTAKVRFSATGESIIPTAAEMEDPIVRNFINRVPTASYPNNRTGALSITPVNPNLGFWFKKFALNKKGTKSRLHN